MTRNTTTLITGKDDQGRSIWLYVNIKNLKKPIYDKEWKRGSINPDNFGEVVSSGLGESPPAMISNLVEGFSNGSFPILDLKIVS